MVESLKSPVVLVVGTTPDYVERLHRIYPDGLCFLMDSSFWGSPFLNDIPSSFLLFCSLDNGQESTVCVDRHFFREKQTPIGVACFDCESLLLASRLASKLGLPFPPADAVLRARNKFECRGRWNEAGVPSPRALLCSSLKETREAFDRLDRDVVLKPLSGSGSELLFHCTQKGGIDQAVKILKKELPLRKSHPLFRPLSRSLSPGILDPCKTWIVEEYIPGPEFSCDFILEKDRVTVLRETGKVRAPDQSFGSVLAYRTPPAYPRGFSTRALGGWLRRAAGALGFTWGHFMADFLVRERLPMFIEMTPRPGGDSIPDLIREAAGKDLLKFYLDFVSGRAAPRQGVCVFCGTFASINLFAPREGILRRLDPSKLLAYPWVRHFFPRKAEGDRICLPPKCYDDRVLGYAVIAPETSADLVSLSAEIRETCDVCIEGTDFEKEMQGGIG